MGREWERGAGEGSGREGGGKRQVVTARNINIKVAERTDAK